MVLILRVLIFSLPIFLTFSCKKDKILEDSSAKLQFSTDTVLFDTVFTTIGSTTKQFKIYNTHNRTLLISQIKLAGGPSSQFRINVDGRPVSSIGNIEIAAKDSLFVFVEVTVDPLNSNSPLIVSDSIIFQTNGNVQDIDLVAWGQDAHYFYPTTYREGLPPYSIICSSGSNTWINDKPYVIYGYAVVDSGCTLNIEEGVRVHLHKNGGLWIFQGATLNVNGTKDKPVTFQGDRLEQEYKDIEGQWDRIILNDGSNHKINYAIIKNGFIGIQAEPLDFKNLLNNGQLDITNTIIKNMSAFGIFTRFFAIAGSNNVISNCAQHTLAITYGGAYDFKHCTFANYWSGPKPRQTPSIYINSESNFPLSQCTFSNSILYGDIENEILIEDNTTEAFNYMFNYSLLKTNIAVTDPAHFNGVLVNQDPAFKDRSVQDYHLNANSAARDKGDINAAALVPEDIEKINRTATPDLGAYEFQ